MVHEQTINQGRHVIDAFSVGAIVVTIMGWLTPILTALATLASIVWFGYQIYDLRDRRRRRNHDPR